MNAIDRPAPTGLTPARLLQLGLGCGLLGLGGWLLWDFPVGRLWLSVLAAGLAVAQWHDPRAWLVALPVVLACVDLGAWSGRLLVGEQDALLAVLAGSALVAGHYGGSGRQLLRRSFVPVWFVVLALLIGFGRGLLPLAPLDGNAWNGYLTGWNALRVAKGPLWALAFWPLLAAQLSADREATESRLALGLVVAMIGFGGYILWERSFFSDLVTAQSSWDLVKTWLDLSGTYRITGPSSQMHLGGEAVDGFLILAWPFALWALVRARRWTLSAAGLVALALAAYALIVTFTRTTYLAAGVAFLAFVAMGVSGNAHLSAGRLMLMGGFAVVSAVLFLIGFHFGGSLLLLAYLPVLLGGTAAGRFERWVPSRELLAGGLTILLALGVALALRGILTSKWSDLPFGPALAIVLPSVLVLGLGGLAVGRAVRSWLGWREAVALLLGLGLLLPAVTLGLSGTQIHARAATASADLKNRIEHWRRGLSLVPGDLATRVFGAGLGSFPLTNLLASSAHSEGTWHFSQGAPESYLRLVGTGSLCYGQRVVGLAPGSYRILARVRNPSGKAATLTVKLQPRRMLELEGWQPRTQELGFPLDPTDWTWQEVAARVDLTSASAPPWHNPAHAVFVLTNYGAAGSAIDIAALRLVDARGREWLMNGNFAAGGDRWFAYNDFHHLAWHLKSLYVALYFDLGLLGLLAFGVLSATALGRTFDEARRGRLFGAALGAALVGFLVLGLTGTLLDVPPLMTLFLLLTLAGLWRERARRRIVRRRRQPDQTPSGPPGSLPAGCGAQAS